MTAPGELTRLRFTGVSGYLSFISFVVVLGFFLTAVLGVGAWELSFTGIVLQKHEPCFFGRVQLICSHMLLAYLHRLS